MTMSTSAVALRDLKTLWPRFAAVGMVLVAPAVLKALELVTCPWWVALLPAAILLLAAAEASFIVLCFRLAQVEASWARAVVVTAGGLPVLSAVLAAMQVSTAIQWSWWAVTGPFLTAWAFLLVWPPLFYLYQVAYRR